MRIWGTWNKRAFIVEYVYYILALLVIGLVCLLTIRLLTRRETNHAALQYAKRQEYLKSRQAAANKKSRGGQVAKHPSVVRELQSLRSPWGWPGHAAKDRDQDESVSMKTFTQRLLKEKELARKNSINMRTSASVRALLEDRYGRVNKEEMQAVPYEKVKAPLLRDPSEPHDQMDNFGAGSAERIRTRLEFTDIPVRDRAPSEKKKEFRYVELQDIKQPWGW